jgi:DNA-binding transcriptional ArsR family regulator
MDWISSTHLEQLATLEPSAAMLGLVVWTQSGGAPYQADAPRFPVRVGSISDAAELLGMSRATVKRHWPSFTAAFVELDPGRFTPSITAWRDPAVIGPRDAQGRPLYVRVHQDAVRALTQLARHASARTAWAAFKLAVRLLPRLRSDAHRGKGSTVWTNDQIASQLGMGRTTLTRALQLLERCGLVVTFGGRYRRISTRDGLLALVPRVRSPGFPQPVENHHQRITTGPPDRSYSYRSPKGVELDQTQEQAPRARGTAVGVCSHAEKIQIFQEHLPTLSDIAALELAKLVSSPLQASEWVHQETNVMTDPDTADPVGTFLWLVRHGGSRPGKPSAWSKKLARAGQGSPQRPLTPEEQAEAVAELQAHQIQMERLRGERQEQADRLRAARLVELERIETATRDASTLAELRGADTAIRKMGSRPYVAPKWVQDVRQLLAPRLIQAEAVEAQRQRQNNREQSAALLQMLRG